MMEEIESCTSNVSSLKLKTGSGKMNASEWPGGLMPIFFVGKRCFGKIFLDLKHPLNVLVIKVNSPEFNFWWPFNLIPFGKNCWLLKLDHFRQINIGVKFKKLSVSNNQDLHPNLRPTAKLRVLQNFDGFLCSLAITWHKASLRHKDTSHPRPSSVTSFWDGAGQLQN